MEELINFKTSNDDKELICALGGRLGADRCEIIREKTEAEIMNFSSEQDGAVEILTLDLKEVQFIASSFIRLCITFAKSIGKKNFRIVNTSPLIKRTFKVAGLEDELNVR